MPKKFKSPYKNYQIGNFETTKRPHSPSPKRMDFQKRAVSKDDGKSRCTYIHPETGKRCKNKLGVYPEYCEMHTMMVHNLYIDISTVPNGGNGLFAGPYGLKKGDIIGQYNERWNEVSMKTLERRCKNDKCYAYVFCDDEDNNGHQKCWDAADIRSTLVRNANDAHGTEFRNNAYFEIKNGNVYMIASRNIKPKHEVLVYYGRNYF